jgi:hypothetical protein
MMMSNNHEGYEKDARDPVVEEAFRLLVQHTRAPRGFHPRVMARIAAERPTFRDRLVRWISPPWQPTWAGEVVTAADVSTQEHVFYLDDGEIQVTCGWRAAYRNLPATLRVTWQAQVSTPGDFWVRFTHPNDPARPPIEVRLGNTVAGEEEFTAETLGFDPTREPWAVAILLRAPEP